MGRNISQYFNQIGSMGEQRLIEDLVIEGIRLTGLKIYYLPRTLVNLDPILGEDPISKFVTYFTIEAYFDDPTSWQGDGYLITKFGLDMHEGANFVISRRRYNEVFKRDGFNSIPNFQVTDVEVRPKEGDLIYLPVTNDIFQIEKAEHESVFHQLGKLYVWRIDVFKFKYSHEIFNTGIPEIDRVQVVFQNVDSTTNDPLAQNDELVSEAIDIINTTEKNIFGDPV